MVLQEESINLITLFRNFYRYRWSVFIILISTITATFFYAKQITPIYSSNMLISIERDQASSIKSLFPNSNVVNIDMENQLDYDISILKSRHIISKVLERIDLSKRFFVKESWKDRELYKDEIPFKIKFNNKSLTISSFEFIIEEIDNKHFMLQEKEVKENNRTLYEYEKIINRKNYELKIYKREEREFLSNKIYTIKIENNKNILISNILNNLSIEKKINKLLDINYEDRIPARARDIITQLVLSYEEYILNSRQLKDVSNIAFFDKMILELEKTLKNIGKELRGYRSQHSELLLLGSEDKIFLNTIEKNHNISELSLKLNALKSTKKRINNGMYSTSLLENNNLQTDDINQLLEKLRDRKEHLTILHRQNRNIESLIVDDVDYRNMLYQLKKSKKELRELTIEYTEIHPQVKKIQTDIDQIKIELETYLTDHIEGYSKETIKLKEEINKIINALINSIQREYSNIKKSLSRDKKSIDQLPQSTMKLEELKRSFQLNENNHERLLQKRSESIISKESITSNIQIVDNATYPIEPIRPKKTFFYLSGLILGLLLSIIYTSFRIYRDKRIYSRHDIVLNNYSLIYKENKDKGDNFWTLIAHIERVKSRKRSKVILISSNGYEEDKSITTQKLSLALDNISKKTVVIDFDIYKGKLTYHLNLNSLKGLSTILTSKHTLKEIEIKEYIHNHKKIDILPSGPIIPNGSSLLFNPKIETIVENLSLEYDYILIDAPPIGEYPVTKILLKYIDIFLIVAKIKKTDRRFFEKIQEINEKEMEKIVFLNNP